MYSRTPQFSFSSTFDEQQDELQNNLILKRFVKSRQALSLDRYRPIYHFVSPESNLNDPNGLCYWQGKWHLFYQGFPAENDSSFNPLHWGHAVSEDLIHWQDLPYAIYPGPEISCFSGSTLVEDDRVIAMYHGVGCGNMIAVSSDPLLLNWEKLSGGAVIKEKDFLSCPRVFDPCIWRGIDYYYSLSGGNVPNLYGPREHRADFLFRSKDLIHWEYLHDFLDGDVWGKVGDDGACPYFWPIGDSKYILLHYSHMSGGAYMIGDYNRHTDKFHVSNGGDFTFGRTNAGNIHAPSATPAPDDSGDVICIFNINTAKPTQNWNQIMSLPRRLSLYNGDRLAQDVTGDIASLRYNEVEINTMTLPANQEIILDKINGDAIEIELEVELLDSDFFELNVLRSPNKEEYTRVAFYKDRGYRNNRHRELRKFDSVILIDNCHSSLASDVTSCTPACGEFEFPNNQNLKLHIFIDKSVVEVFANGRQSVALRVYPERTDSTGVSVFAGKNKANIVHCRAWQMKSIY